VDQILIAGPQLRKSAEVVAVLQYNASRRKVRRALDRLVRRGGAAGSWLDAGVPAARARADGAERVFVMPVPNIVVVGPPSISQQALSLPSDFHFDPPAGAEALGVHLVTPHRALLGLPFSIPSSLKWARINITPTAAGGAIARAVAEDESEQAAKATAATLKRLLAPYLVLDFIERIDFHAQGANVYGEVEATERQLAFLLELARQQQQKYAQAQAQRQQAKRGPASVSGPRSPAGARSAAPSSASGAQPRTATPPAGSASGRPSARP
jgi:hypothetical protein